MKKILRLLVLVCLITVSTTNLTKLAYADTFGIYLAPKLGLTMQSKDSAHFSDTGNTSSSLGSNLNTGLVGGLAIGYDLQFSSFALPLRLEFEALFRTSTKAQSTWTATNTYDVEQKVGMSTYFINMYYDFYTSSVFVPYVGFGLGFANVSQKLDVNGTSFEDSSLETAFNLGLGISWLIKSGFVVDLSYRYTYPTQSSLNFNNYTSEIRSTAHDILFALRYTF